MLLTAIKPLTNLRYPALIVDRILLSHLCLIKPHQCHGHVKNRAAFPALILKASALMQYQALYCCNLDLQLQVLLN